MISLAMPGGGFCTGHTLGDHIFGRSQRWSSGVPHRRPGDYRSYGHRRCRKMGAV